jgi:hypothetical protein
MNHSVAVIRFNLWHPLDAMSGVEQIVGKAWKYGWGLVFVLAMTVLAEWGPRLNYSKEPPAPPPVVSPVAGHAVK